MTTVRIQLRRDTAANWSTVNPVLKNGEPGVDTTNDKIKIGDGVTAWNSLPYFDDQETVLSNYNGHIIPSADNTYDLGSPARQWRDLFVSNGSIYIGDIKLSNDNGTLLVQRVTDAGLETEEPIGTPGVVTTDRLVNGENTFVLMDDGTLEINGEIFTGGGSGSTDRLVNGIHTVSLGPDGDLTVPDSTSIIGSNDLVIRSSVDGNNSGLFLNGNPIVGSVVLYANSVATIRADNDGTSKDWNFDKSGTITTPLLLPKSFTAVLDSEHFAVQPGRGLTDVEWEYGVEFQVNPDGTVQTLIDDPVRASNPGYLNGDTFRFTEADHGIPGYTFDLTLTTIVLEGSNYVAAVAVSQPPEYPSTVKSLGAIKLTADTQSWVFGTDGKLKTPAGLEIYDELGQNGIISNSGLQISSIGGSQLSLIWNLGEGSPPDGPNQDVIASGIFQDTSGVNIEVIDEQSDSKTWSFRSNGILRLPAGGDIVDSTGNSVLGGSADQLSNTEETFTLSSDGDVTFSGPTGGINRGLVWDYGAEIEGTNSTIRQDNDGLSVKAWTTYGGGGSNGDNSAPVNIRTNQGENEKWWTFAGDGNLTLPEGGDILDSTGNSVLDGGAPSIPSTKKGWINLVGDKPNNNDDAWFESVVVQGDYAYAVGGDYYVDNSDNLTKIYKFDLATGDQVWVKEIVAGRGAQFDFSITSEVITITNIAFGGAGYIEGEELHFGGWIWGGNTAINRVTVLVDTVDETGSILTASIKPGYNLTGISNGTWNGNIAENNNAEGFPASIAYDTNLDKLIIVSLYRSGLGDRDFDNYYTWANVYAVDPVTGVINQTVTLSTEGDIYPNSLKVKNSPGGVVVSGEKYGEFRLFGTLIIEAGSLGYFDILKSNLDPEHYPGGLYDSYSDFWISGTGIPTVNNVDNVNNYPGLPTEVRQGSGATFTIVDNAGAYVAGAVNQPGNNYLPGHKILIPGTSLGGLTPNNDCIVTVVTVDNGGVLSFNVSGTGAGNTQEYTNISGTNFQTGSGLTLTALVNRQTGAVSINYFENYGTGYVNGDVVTISGTLFAGGTSPANDVTFTINNVGVSGEAYGWDEGSVTGSAPSDRLRIYVDGVDFTVSDGSWSMKQNLGGEAFLWTPTWSNAIGGPSGDKFYDVCYSQDGNSIFAVGRGRYETAYDQALVVKFNATTGAVIWGKDIKFSEATTNSREARSVCLVPGSSDLIIAGAWYNDAVGDDELILTRITEAGTAVWQKSYLFNYDGSTLDIDYEMKVEAYGNNVIVSLDSATPQHSRALGYLIINPTNGVVVDSRVLSADGNGNRNFYEITTPNFSDIYTDGNGDSYIVMAGMTYVPTDNYYNGLLLKLPLDGYTNLAEGEYVSIGEHILGKYSWNVTALTSAFDSFTPLEHVDTIDQSVDQRGYAARTPDAELKVFRTDITKDSDGFLEFGDGSKQSFATNLIPQIPASTSYYLTEQDSGKHIFFEDSSGEVYIPHWTAKNLPVGFTFTIVNTSGNDCYVTTQTGEVGYRARLKLAGRNIDTYTIGIPDSGSGSMVTLLKVKSGYSMLNTDYDDYYSDVWMVSGPGDIYDND